MEIILIVRPVLCIILIIWVYFKLRIKDREHKLNCSLKIAKTFENKTTDEAEVISKILNAFNSHDEIKLPRLPGKE